MYNNNSLLFLNNIKNTIIGAILLIVYTVLVKDFNIYFLLNNIITVAMILVFIYINMIRIKFVDKTFMKYFEFKYFMSIIIIILNIIGIISLLEDQPITYFVFLFSIQATLECCEIENIFKLRNSTLKSIIMCIFYLILFILLFIVFKVNYRLSSDYRLSFFIGSVVVSIIMSVGASISALENMQRNRKEFSIGEFRQVILYIFAILFCYVGLLCLTLGYNEFAMIIIFIKGFTFYKFYNYIISKVLDRSLKRINNNIEIATKTKKELNSILKKRNTILNETNVMIGKSQDKNNELIDFIYGGVFLFYLNKLQYINKRALETLGDENAEILGMDLNEFINKYFHITLSDIKKAGNYVHFAKIKHTNLEVEIFLTCIDEKSEILYIHDMSEINENKKIRKVLEEYLEEDEIKKEFFANISHELKTPINIIFSALQVNQIYLKENKNKNNINSINKNRKIIKQNCLRLIRTINNFIDANKISEGYVIPELRIHNIVELVENISIASNKYIQLIENTLTFDADQEEIYVNCDKEMITRIILNILSNSVKYGKKDGNINVSVGTCVDDDVIIKVTNDGLKIDKKTIPYIFDKFTKLNKAFNRLKEGSGLGLFLTKALIELQGGNIKLVSNSNGNEFIITMPRAKQPYSSEVIHEDWETNPIEEKIDVEFSDIYISMK